MSDKTTPWSRPSGPPNVWKIVEGKEEGLRFSIQEVPEDRRREALELMMKYFLADEPINKCLNSVNDTRMIHDFRLLWQYCLEQGIVEAAYVLDSNGQISELAAVNMLYVADGHSEKEVDHLEKQCQSPAFIRIIDEMVDLSKKADPLTIFEVDRYICAAGLLVAPRFRGQKLGLRMLEARNEIGQKYKIPVTSTVFTARVSQILAEQAGFEVKLIRDYGELLDIYGRPFLPNIETKDMRIMMKRLY